jgi:hypothetical protein
MADPVETPNTPRWRVWAEQALRWLRQLALPWRLLALGLLTVLLLHAFGLMLIPFWPFTTQGTIYVDSPEVYTRERLVNDRYDQDFWLRRQLQLLGEVTPKDLASGRFYAQTALGVGGAKGDAEQPPVAESESKQPGLDGLVFRDRFQVLSGIRDMIRQQILENMLDDRHDLTANSIYGLKFDTTVIPGHNTRDRAFVEITVVPEGPFLGIASGDGGKAYLDTFFCLRQRSLRQDDGQICADIDAADIGRYDDQYDLFLTWLDDIEKRLNTTEESLMRSIASDADCGGVAVEQYGELIRRTLDVVLGLPEKRFLLDHFDRDFVAEAGGDMTSGEDEPASAKDPDDGDDADSEDLAARTGKLPDGRLIRLDDPWAKYMTITARPIRLPGGGDCKVRVDFKVRPLDENYLARRADIPAPELTETQGPCAKGLVWIGVTKNGRWNLWLEGWRFNEMLQSRSASEFAPRYSLSADELDRLPSPGFEQTKLFFGCPAQVVEGDKWVKLPSGFFNFIDSMTEHDAYTYAVFPKNDVLGMITDMAAAASARGVGGALDVSRRLVSSRTEPVSIGYGGGPSAAGDADPTNEGINFGWVIAAPQAMQLSLRTQLALVSVPAWTDQLQVHVRVGWLDQRGRRYDIKTLPTMPIRLPPDVGALDSIFSNQGWVSPAPRIQDEAMDQAVYVVAGQNAKVLIPGARLWRSTSVTLGAQQADRIRVLPNMEGIIAEFQPVELPAAKYNRRPNDDTDPLVTDCPLAKPITRNQLSLSVDLLGGDVADGEGVGFLRQDEGALPAGLQGLQVRPVRLRVWTSEGVALAARQVCVIFDPDTQIRDPLQERASSGEAPAAAARASSADGGAAGAVAEAD